MKKKEGNRKFLVIRFLVYSIARTYYSTVCSLANILYTTNPRALDITCTASARII